MAPKLPPKWQQMGIKMGTKNWVKMAKANFFRTIMELFLRNTFECNYRDISEASGQNRDIVENRKIFSVPNLSIFWVVVTWQIWEWQLVLPKLVTSRQFLQLRSWHEFLLWAYLYVKSDSKCPSCSQNFSKN